MSNTVEQKLFNEIDKICKSTDLLQTLPLGEKVKLLEFRTHLCDLNGATKDALNIVVKAEDSDDKIRTYFIEINGALAKTVAQSSTETYGNAVAFGIASAILAENWITLLLGLWLLSLLVHTMRLVKLRQFHSEIKKKKKQKLLLQICMIVI